MLELDELITTGSELTAAEEELLDVDVIEELESLLLTDELVIPKDDTERELEEIEVLELELGAIELAGIELGRMLLELRTELDAALEAGTSSNAG